MLWEIVKMTMAEKGVRTIPKTKEVTKGDHIRPPPTKCNSTEIPHRQTLAHANPAGGSF